MGEAGLMNGARCMREPGAATSSARILVIAIGLNVRHRGKSWRDNGWSLLVNASEFPCGSRLRTADHRHRGDVVDGGKGFAAALDNLQSHAAQ